MSLVLDASLTLAWFLDGESTMAADPVLEEVVASNAVVPPRWRIEVGNALQTASAGDASTEPSATTPCTSSRPCQIDADSDCDAHCWSATLSLADTHDVTLYDATYLELVQRRRLPLATLDRTLGDSETAGRNGEGPVAARGESISTETGEPSSLGTASALFCLIAFDFGRRERKIPGKPT